MQQKRIFNMGTGVSSILMVFAMLCITTFGILSLVSANADYKLAKKNQEAAEAYYEADRHASEMLAELDSLIASARQYVSDPGKTSLETLISETHLSESQSDAIRNSNLSGNELFKLVIASVIDDKEAYSVSQTDEKFTVSYSLDVHSQKILEVTVEICSLDYKERYKLVSYNVSGRSEDITDDDFHVWPGPAK